MADGDGKQLSRSQKRLRRQYLQQAATHEAKVLGLDESDNFSLGLEDIAMDATMSVDTTGYQPPSSPTHFGLGLRLTGEASGSSQPRQHAAIAPTRVHQAAEIPSLPLPDETYICDVPGVEAPQSAAQLPTNSSAEPFRQDTTRLPDIEVSGIADNYQTYVCQADSSFILDPDSDDMSWVQWSVDAEVHDPGREVYFMQDPPHQPATENFIINEKSNLYEGARITQLESLTAILSFAQSEHLSGAGLSRLLSLVEMHLPEPNLFFKSSTDLFQMLEKIDEPVKVHYFCSNCYKTRPTSTELCDVCVDPSRKVNYFISVPLAPQIQKMLKRPDFVADLNYKTNRESAKENTNNIEDILDGDVYKDVESSSPFTLTAMWNTDGLQIFNSSSFSLWPFFLVINELPPHKRFLSENILIAGIWGSVTKPHPNVYLLPIYKDVKTLEEGISCVVYGQEERCIVKVIVLCGTCDAPARALFLNMKTHSGFYSCPVCLTRGEKSERSNDVCVFPYEEDVTLRSMDQYKQQVEWAVKNRVLHNKGLLNEEAASGIKGPSVLSYFVKNIFKSTSIDGMHCIYLGVTRQVLLLLTDKDLKDKPYSIHAKINVVSKRMIDMSPPHFVQRLPQPLEKLMLWKASELRNFLLYYALCVLVNVLSQRYYDHLMLLVVGISLLNKSSISDTDINLSSLLLSQFVEQFQVLYGVRHMSHNLHMLTHLPMNVKNLGPLWATTCFKFEDMNGRLTNLVHGTRHVGLQIYSHLSVVTQLPLMINNLKNVTVKTYCKSLFKKGKPLNFSDRISQGVHCIGDMTDLSIQFNWIVNKLLEQFNIVVEPTSIKLFCRLLKNNLLYVSTSYTAGKRVSSFVKYSLNNTIKYGVLQTFAKVRGCNCTNICDCSADYVALVKPLELTPCFGNEIVRVHHIYSIVPSDIPEEIVYVECLSTVLFKVDIDTTVYLAEPLNKYELE